jgi:16S rRNA (guanine966-N2)-methyltransferase
VAPAGRGTRPTSDKVREAIFDVLLALPQVRAGWTPLPAGGALSGHVVLDLFAGSGALGIEALSRGACACTFVEHERAALRALRGNLQRLGVTVGGSGERAAVNDGRAPRARVLAVDARRALQADARRGARYTLLFADPPYDRYAEVRPALARLLSVLLAPRAVLVIETAVGTEADLPWTIVREKRYGDTRVTFLVPVDEGAVADDDRTIS